MSRNLLGLMITDTHAKENNIPLVLSIFSQCVKYCLENDIDKVFHLGDWFTDRSKQSLECLLLIDDCISMFEKNGIHIYAIAGNHDKKDQSVHKSYLSIFEKRKSKYFHLFNNTGCIEIEEEDTCIHMLPYFSEAEYLEHLLTVIEDMSNYGDDTKHILMTHHSINGVKNNDGSVVSGDLSRDLFKPFSKVFVGHYHDESHVTKRIHYIGSAYQANYGENIDDKGFTLLYSDDTTIKVHTEFPKYIHYKVNVEDTEQLDELSNSISELKKDNVRITLLGDKDKVQTFNKDKFELAGIEVKQDYSDLELSVGQIQKGSLVLTKKDMAKHWIDYCKLYITDNNLRTKGLTKIQKLHVESK